MYSLKTEDDKDFWEVEALFDLCFAPGREALSSYRLRDGVAKVADLSLVARDGDGVLAGAIRYWPVRIVAPGAAGAVGAGPVTGPVTGPVAEKPFAENLAGDDALLLGPVAVHPTRQGEGLGGVLIRDSLERAAALGWQRVLLVGDAPYYRRFGFSRLEGVKMPPPTNPARVLGRDLAAGAWAGVRGVVVPARGQVSP